WHQNLLDLTLQRFIPTPDLNTTYMSHNPLNYNISVLHFSIERANNKRIMPQLTIPTDDAGRPCLDVQLSIGKEHEKTLQARKMEVPTPRTVRGLMDSGASCTCVDISVVRALGLSSSKEVHFLTPLSNDPITGLQYEVGVHIAAGPTQRPWIDTSNLPVIAFPFSPDQPFHVLVGHDLLSRFDKIHYDKDIESYVFTSKGTKASIPTTHRDTEALPFIGRLFRRSLGDWLPTALKDLKECVGSAHDDGWDPPTDCAMDHARAFLEFLARHIASEPNIYSMGDADIAIDFCTTYGRNNALFVVDDDGSGAVFLSVEGEDDYYQRVEDATEFQKDAVNLLYKAGII
ncbi:MAG: hypothetical protein OXE94_08405, partial [Aestuariivita sp.]|nr:hypothetical protein [Aestuariivita sp.]